MDNVKEAGQKVLISATVLFIVFLLLALLISTDSKLSFDSAIGVISYALETFHFTLNYGIFLLFLSLFIGVFAVYLFEFIVALIKSEFGGVIYMAQTLRFRNHYIICGGGRIGERIASMLKEKGEKTLIVESDETRALELKKLGFRVLKESALEEKTYKMANIKMANGLFAALGQDVDNFIVVLNAKEASKNLKVITRCNLIRNIKKFKELGADEVVLPEIVGADRMVYLAEKSKKR